VCTGKAEKKPVVEGDKLVIKEMLSTVYTFDHRFGDAALSQKFCKIIKAYVEDPENFDIDKFE
jgi:pyruvate dehydrogenase E2 component (dihydrolipoamide acetyltransferase)